MTMVVMTMTMTKKRMMMVMMMAAKANGSNDNVTADDNFHDHGDYEGGNESEEQEDAKTPWRRCREIDVD